MTKAASLLKRQSIIVGLLAAAICWLSGGRHETQSNNYVYLAQAFLEGHPWIHWPGIRIDALPWHGRYYVIEAPVPALLLMPMILIMGHHAHQSLLGVMFAGIAIGAAWNLLERMAVSFHARYWLTLFLFAGTDIWWCASLGDVWLIAHLGAFAASMLALREIAGANRGWLIALFAGAAVGCRFSLIMAIPIYAALMYVRLRAADEAFDVRRLVGKLLPYCTVIVIGLAAWIWYNEIRFGVLNDIGYNEWYKQDSFGSGGGPFQLRFFPYEFTSMFLALPKLINHRPWVVAPVYGQGMLFTSPALIFAFFARGKRAVIALLWLATFLVGAPSFIYYANGFEQFGMRHALDFEPFLFALMGLAAINGIPRWMKVLCAYSIVVGIWGVLCWHVSPRWI